MEKIKTLWFENESDNKSKICIQTEKGGRYERLLSDVEKLNNASQKELNDFKIGPSGYIVRWEKLGVSLFNYFFIPPEMVVNTLFEGPICKPYNEVVYICSCFFTKFADKAKQINISSLDYLVENVEKIVNEYISLDDLLILDDTLQMKRPIVYPVTNEQFSYSRFIGRYFGFNHVMLNNDEYGFTDEVNGVVDTLIEKIVYLHTPDFSKKEIQLGLLEGMSIAFNNEDIRSLYSDTNIDLNRAINDCHIKSYEYGLFYEKIIAAYHAGMEGRQIEQILINDGLSETEAKDLLHDVLHGHVHDIVKNIHNRKQRKKIVWSIIVIVVVILIIAFW